jgi:NDP-sugar pyrophosphorylase family protein
MKLIKHVIILAAGRGMRLMPLTKKIPKALVKLHNQSLILRGIKKIRNYTKNIHITVGYRGSMIAEHVIKNKVNSVINTDGKGNCWWIFNFPFNLLNEPILVLTCDNITSIDFQKIFTDYKKKNNPPCMLIPVKPILGLEGDYIHRENNFVKKLSRIKKSEIYCSGIQILNPKKINNLMKEKKDFKEVWKSLIKKKKLVVSDIVPKKWFTIDRVEQLNFFNKKFKYV